MNTRLRQMRKALKLTQVDMAYSLGISQTQYSQLENGIVGISEPYIKLICLKFNVNEQWFRTGDGEMFYDCGYLNEIIEIYKGFDTQFRWMLHKQALDMQELSRQLDRKRK